MEINSQNTNIDNLQLKRVDEERQRQKLIFRFTFSAILVVFLCIVAIIAEMNWYIIAKLFCGQSLQLEMLTKSWHLYLISLVALTTVLSVLAMLNKATWYKKDESSNNQLGYSVYDLLKQHKAND